MNQQTDFTYMASLYMALADQTRLRLLLQMYGGEICVAEIANALGDSQPKISRHLAYLRNAGIVNTRRDGKWIHYSIRWPEAEGAQMMLRAALEWLADGQKGASQGDIDRSRSKPAETITAAPLDIYADVDVNEEEYEPRRAAHNELEEFLL